jgi:hypothetical protein
MKQIHFLFMTKPVGGRGKKVPYTSTHARIPEPIKSHVDVLVCAFHDGTLPEPELLASLLQGKQPEQNSLPTLPETLEVAKKILRGKTSKIESIANLLTAIYGQKITKEELEKSTQKEIR